MFLTQLFFLKEYFSPPNLVGTIKKKSSQQIFLTQLFFSQILVFLYQILFWQHFLNNIFYPQNVVGKTFFKKYFLLTYQILLWQLFFIRYQTLFWHFIFKFLYQNVGVSTNDNDKGILEGAHVTKISIQNCKGNWCMLRQWIGAVNSMWHAWARCANKHYKKSAKIYV